MKTLLVLTVALEGTTAFALLAAPSLVVDLLLGVPLDTPAGLAIGRLAGVALLALVVTCWSASRDVTSRAAAGVVRAMLVYNVGAVALLGYCRCCAGMSGMGLVPAAVLHAALAAWCVACLRASPKSA